MPNNICTVNHKSIKLNISDKNSCTIGKPIPGEVPDPVPRGVSDQGGRHRPTHRPGGDQHTPGRNLVFIKFSL